MTVGDLHAPGLSDVDWFFVPNGDAPRTTIPPVRTSHGLQFKTLRSWRATYRRPSWLIRKFLIAGGFDVICGAEKSLKSWLMYHVAVALAACVPLFDVRAFGVTDR